MCAADEGKYLKSDVFMMFVYDILCDFMLFL